MTMTMKIERHLPFSNAKTHLLKILREIEEQHGKVILTKNGKPKAVLMSYEDFEGLIETVDILSDARTAAGIRRGIKDIKAGRTVTIEEAFRD